MSRLSSNDGNLALRDFGILPQIPRDRNRSLLNMEMVKDALNWFEIPTVDFERAQSFYSKIFDYDMPVMPMGDVRMGMPRHEQGSGVGGAIIHGDGRAPSGDGVLIYLNGGADLAVVLGRVEAAGGQVAMPKTEIGQGFGYCACFVDTEGNKIGLHSMG